MIQVRVAGIPIPQGSMRGFVRGGRVVVTSDNPRLRSWRRDLTIALAEAAWATAAGPMRLELHFVLPRPAGHFGRRGLLPSAPSRPIGARSDLDKLVRAVGDAATGAGVWRDDGQVVELVAEKLWVCADEPRPGVRIFIREL